MWLHAQRGSLARLVPGAYSSNSLSLSIFTHHTQVAAEFHVAVYEGRFLRRRIREVVSRRRIAMRDVVLLPMTKGRFSFFLLFFFVFFGVLSLRCSSPQQLDSSPWLNEGWRPFVEPPRAPWPPQHAHHIRAIANTPRLVLIRLAPSTRVPPVVASCPAQMHHALRPTRTN